MISKIIRKLIRDKWENHDQISWKYVDLYMSSTKFEQFDNKSYFEVKKERLKFFPADLDATANSICEMNPGNIPDIINYET